MMMDAVTGIVNMQSLMLHRNAFAGVVAILALFVAGPNRAEAQTASLIGDWQSCEPNVGCDIRFSFFPNRTVIKQYLLLGGTVTSRGRYRQEGGGLQIVWTRVSPKRICGVTVDADGHNHKQCVHPTEHTADGPLTLEGFNTLVWKISGGQPLRLVRRED
jgi:hypothetical protein